MDLSNTTPSGIYTQAYRLCASIRALKASNGLCAEYGAVERLESLLRRHAEALNIGVSEVWGKYDRAESDRHLYRVESQIEAGQFDESVAKRTARLAGAPAPKPESHIKVTLEDGNIASIHFDINHGLPNGSYSLIRNPE